MSDEMIEGTCTWPDGQVRRVVVVNDDGEYSKILWNEKVDSSSKAVMGCDETVPSKWISDKTEV